MKKALFAYGFAQGTSQTAINYMANFNWVVSEFELGTDVARIKTANSATQVLGQHGAIIAFPTDPEWSILNPNESWFLHDIGGLRIQTAGGGYLLDISNAGLRSYIAGVLANYCTTYGFDGVLLVDAWGAFLTDRWTVPATSIPASIISNWNSWMLGFVTAIKSALSSKKLILFTDYANSSLIAVADGYLDAEFLHPDWYTETDWYDSYIRPYDHIIAMQTNTASGKVVIASCGTTNPSTPTVAYNIALYCFAGALLGDMNDNAVFASGSFYSANQGLYDFMNTDTGLPSGAFYQSGAVYKRDFAKVTATADLTNHVGTVTTVGPPTCPPGYHWDATANACVPNAGGAGRLMKGLFAYGFGQGTSQTAINHMARFDYVLTEFNIGTDVARIKAVNPSATVLGYKDGVYTANAFNTPEWSTITTHEDWFLHDSLGNRIESAQFPGSFLLAIGNTALQSFLATLVRGYCDTYGFDGLFLDDAWGDFDSSAYRWRLPAGATIPSSIGLNWQTWMSSFVAAMKAQLPSYMLIVNTHYAVGSYLISLADGYLDEEFLHPSWYTESDWYDGYILPLNRVQAMKNYTSAGKVVLVNCGTLNPSSPAVARNIALYAYVGALLGNENNNGVFTASSYYGPEMGYYDFMDTSTGLALGSLYASGGLYKRDFENLTAVVDFVNHTGTLFPSGGSTVNLTVSASTGGSTSPVVGTYPFNLTSPPATQTVTATASANFRFDHWELDGTNVGTATSFTVTMDANHTLRAVFASAVANVTVVAGAGGAVSPTGTFPLIIGSAYSFVATPNNGYRLDHWELAGTSIGTDATLTLNVTAQMDGATITAVFVPVPVTLNVSTSGNGTTNPTGSQTYNAGQTARFTALAQPNNRFVNWNLNGAIYTANPLDLTVTTAMQGATLLATFEPTIVTITVVAGANGTVAPSGSYTMVVGNTYGFRAQPNQGYLMDRWDLDGVIKGTLQDLSLVASLDMQGKILTATFSQQPPPPRWTLTVSASANGTVSPSGNISGEAGMSTPPITATPNTNYQFSDWVIDGVPNASLTNPLTMTISDVLAHTLQARFVLLRRNLVIQSATGGNTTPIAGAYSYEHGTLVQVGANASVGYAFNYWVLDGVNAGTLNPIQLAMSADHTLSPVFRDVTVLLTIASAGNGLVEPSGTLSLTIGSAYPFIATPSANFKLDHWELAGANLGSSSILVLTATEQMDGQTLTAYFTELPPVQVVLNVVVVGEGTTTPSPPTATVNVGSTVTFTAVPKAGELFISWAFDGKNYTDNPLALPITLDMNGKTLTATFSQKGVMAGFPLWSIPLIVVGAIGGGYALKGDKKKAPTKQPRRRRATRRRKRRR